MKGSSPNQMLGEEYITSCIKSFIWWNKYYFSTLPNRRKSKKHTWDRIPRGRFHTTILDGLFQTEQKGGLTKVVQSRLKRVFSTFPIGAKKKNCDRIPRGRFHTTILSGLFQTAKTVGLTKVGQSRSKRVISSFPIGAKQKTPLGSNSTRSVSYHHFRPIAFKTRYFEFPHRGEKKKTLGIEFREVGFIPPFWVGFSKQRKSRVDEGPPIAFKTRFYRLSPSERNEKTYLGWNSTRSISYHHFGWAFPSSRKRRVDEGRRSRSKRV